MHTCLAALSMWQGIRWVCVPQSTLTNGSTLNGSTTLRGWGRGGSGRGSRVGPNTEPTVLMPQDSLAAEGKVCCSASAVAAQLHLCAHSYAVTYSNQKLV